MTTSTNVLDAAAQFAAEDAYDLSFYESRQHRRDTRKLRSLGLLDPLEMVSADEVTATLRRYNSDRAAKRVTEAAKRAGRRRWEFLSGNDLLSLGAPKWLALSFLPEVGLAQLSGAQGSHKSGLLIDLGLSVSNGLDNWMGHKLILGGTVIYIALEGKFDFHMRLRAWLKLHPGASLDRFVAVMEPELDLSSAYDLNELVGRIDDVLLMQEDENRNPRLVIVDTQGLALPGVNEDSATEMNEAFRGIKSFAAEMGCLVVLAHHSGWDPQRERGSSAQRQAVDVSMMSHGDRVGGTVTVNKNKAGPKPPPWSFVVEEFPIEGDTSIAVRLADTTESVVMHIQADAEVRAQIHAFVNGSPECSKSAVHDSIGGNRTALLQLIDVLVADPTDPLVNVGSARRPRLVLKAVA